MCKLFHISLQICAKIVDKHLRQNYISFHLNDDVNIYHKCIPY